ncbi:type II toxin-antitoxin system RelE/ParE family toxin [Pinibacter aurantiacus]|uniref:Toxin n=1 Tax=Pinibacter aurantiacus TaxID=2851599 RepID=A0A9E2SA29_9BACT|nr:type II toxin-antitoxin system RelE/ParE family toxin [Pinibacter aurantiacus]MBV4358362.1 type II toxin-antitoxin system RelE/ParE family toxin [Pinibacter aurantiacus]
MKPFPYVISKDALSDLNEIWLYTTERWSAEQADRYYNLIFDEINFICKNPNAGKSKEHIRKGYRASKVKSHLIFYRVVNEVIEVIRILHENMDIENRLSD